MSQRRQTAERLIRSTSCEMIQIQDIMSQRNSLKQCPEFSVSATYLNLSGQNVGRKLFPEFTPNTKQNFQVTQLYTQPIIQMLVENIQLGKSGVWWSRQSRGAPEDILMLLPRSNSGRLNFCVNSLNCIKGERVTESHSQVVRLWFGSVTRSRIVFKQNI